MTKREKLAPIMGIIALIKDGGKGILAITLYPIRLICHICNRFVKKRKLRLHYEKIKIL